MHADGGSRVHAADNTPSKNAVTRASHCNFIRQGYEGRIPSAAAGSYNVDHHTDARLDLV